MRACICSDTTCWSQVGDLQEEVFTSVDRISRLQNRLVSLLILILKSIKLSYSTSLRRAGSTLGHPVSLQLATDTILNSLSEDYKPFLINYNMNNMEKSIAELHSMLKTAKLNMGAKNKTKDVLMVRDGGVKKKHGYGGTNKGNGPVQAVQSAPKVRENIKGKGKGKKVKPNKARTENRCFTCNGIGHWRQNCPKRHEAGKWSEVNARDCKDLKHKDDQIILKTFPF
ncbi:hypothetical protein OSB04_019144 [Centaurea solstitialis]|uniref:CCHC-type domain-containing protein n=1 Tax=Centaurea solstitialis TaxID=347529 RepID=A0AA38T356_9ASTR|nr:hypothetical protein OSB04_019144 [Centaurea solstitialis]